MWLLTYYRQGLSKLNMEARHNPCYFYPMNSHRICNKPFITHGISRVLAIVTLCCGGNFCRVGDAHAANATPELAAQVRAFILTQVVQPADMEIEIGLNAVSKLPNTHCAVPVELRLFSPRVGIGNTNVLINCAAKPTWRANLPVTVRGYAPVVVANRSLLPGQVVTLDDVRQIRLDVATLHNGYYTQPSRVNGAIVKRAVVPGMPVYAHQLRPAYVVKRGEKVVLKNERGGLSIHMTGEALKDGLLGDLIPVKNLRSGRVVEGRVTRPQEVSVHL